MSVQIHYNIDKLLKTNANIFLIVGEKSNGKSFQVKNKIALDNYFKHKSRFALTRRWDTDMKQDWVVKYFSDVDIESKTDNKYTGFTTYRGAIYLGNINEKTMKIKPQEKIGYVMPLNMEQHFSSGSYLDIDYIIFEEFMERRRLYKERTGQVNGFLLYYRQKKRYNKVIFSRKYNFKSLSVYQSMGLR